MKKLTIVLSIFGALVLLLSCAGGKGAKLQADAQSFIDEYTGEFVSLWAESSEAEWALNTRIVEGDDTNRKRTEAANQAWAAFTARLSSLRVSSSEALFIPWRMASQKGSSPLVSRIIRRVC